MKKKINKEGRHSMKASPNTETSAMSTSEHPNSVWYKDLTKLDVLINQKIRGR
jgi:hypothetical protein